MEEKSQISLINSLVNNIRRGNWDRVKENLQSKSFNNVVFLDKTALHWACELYSPEDIIKLILSKWPDSALVQDAHGLLPIHYSIRCEDKEVTKLLIEVAPETISKLDSRDETPLFSCMQTKGFLKNIEQMLKVCPSALTQRNGHGETAMDYFFGLWYGFVYGIVNDSEDQVLNNSRLAGYGWTCEEIVDISCLLLSSYDDLRLDTTSNQLSFLESAILNPSCPWIFCELLVRLAPNEIESLRKSTLFLCTADVRKPVYDTIYVCSKCGNQFNRGIIHRDYFSCNECLAESSFFKDHSQTVRDEELEKIQLVFVCLQMNPILCNV